jgi:hypothetical protein
MRTGKQRTYGNKTRRPGGGYQNVDLNSGEARSVANGKNAGGEAAAGNQRSSQSNHVGHPYSSQ